MLIVILAILCAATLFALLLGFFGFRSDATRHIAELERAGRTDPDEAESRIMRRILKNVNVNAVSSKLSEAGWYRMNVNQFVMLRFICAGIGVGLAFIGTLLAHQPGLMLLSGLVAGALGFIVPTFVIDRACKKRKSAIARRIPDLLDMVSTTVEAGTALNSALATAVNSLEGPLAEEVGIVLSDVRLGRARADAFNAMALRVKQDDLSSMVTAIVQTERLGGNIGGVLDELAQEARARRLARAEEIAARLPVLMILPMAFFMLPALFVMIFTPVIAHLLLEHF